MDLDDGRGDRDGGRDLRGIGGDEQRHADARAAQLRDRRRKLHALAGDVEPAFGGALLAAFRHQAGGMRPRLDRDRDHLVGCGHFEVEWLGDLGLEACNIVVADMPAILAQMRGDAIGAGRDRDLGGLHRIGMRATARVADGRNVIDVHTEAKVGSRRHRR